MVFPRKPNHVSCNAGSIKEWYVLSWLSNNDGNVPQITMNSLLRTTLIIHKMEPSTGFWLESTSRSNSIHDHNLYSLEGREDLVFLRMVIETSMYHVTRYLGGRPKMSHRTRHIM